MSKKKQSLKNPAVVRARALQLTKNKKKKGARKDILKIRKQAVSSVPLNKYIETFIKCKDSNIVGVGIYHIILDHPNIPRGYYFRIGFDIQKSWDPPKRLDWSDFVSKFSQAYPFTKPTLEPTATKLSKDTIRKIEGLKEIANKKELYKFWRMRCGEGIPQEVMMYGETVLAAERNLAQHLNMLDLKEESDRAEFKRVLGEMTAQLNLYVEAAIFHLESYSWTSFTFDLKASNALIYTNAKGEEHVFLSDLDAEKVNCFHDATIESRIFVQKNKETIALAALLVWIANSTAELGATKVHDDKLEVQLEAHKHPDCPEYLFAEYVHEHFKALADEKGENYKDAIKKLFQFLTETPFWSKSTLYLTHYLNLPTGSAGYQGAWKETTNEEAPETEKGLKDWSILKKNLNKRRWLLLLFLNIFKCSRCQKPPKWILDDLVVPIWDTLMIKENGLLDPERSVRFELSLDKLAYGGRVDKSEQIVKVGMEHSVPAGFFRMLF